MCGVFLSVSGPLRQAVNGQMSLSDRLLAPGGPCHKTCAPRGDGVGQRETMYGKGRERALFAPCH